MVCLSVACHAFGAKSLPEVTQAALDEMGVTYGTPQMSGFVFVNGRYLPPPYTVTRRGNALFINRYQIEQPVAWSYFDSTVVDTPETVDPAELDHEEDSVGAAPAQVSSIDALFSEDQGAAADTAPKEQGAKTIKSIDDLFGDEDVQREEPAPGPRAQNISHIDDLFTDDEPPKRAPVNLFRPQPVAPVVAFKPAVPQTPEQLQAKKEILKARLDQKRDSYERALAKGELYFFNTSHNQINGNYGTARTLIEVLPAALRYARSPSELLSRLRSGSVYFIDFTTCEALYKHKTTFPLLQQRLDNIKEMEYLKAARKE
ncbi:MAG: hypothetical protein PHO37_04390 [Kiritimatiellae bacterium]|nr:hypothetical protein [Kiritimatiellia bacterium]